MRLLRKFFSQIALVGFPEGIFCAIFHNRCYAPPAGRGGMPLTPWRRGLAWASHCLAHPLSAGPRPRPMPHPALPVIPGSSPGREGLRRRARLSLDRVECRQAVAVLRVVPAFPVRAALFGEGGARFH